MEIRDQIKEAAFQTYSAAIILKEQKEINEKEILSIRRKAMQLLALIEKMENEQYDLANQTAA